MKTPYINTAGMVLTHVSAVCITLYTLAMAYGLTQFAG